MGTCRTIPNGAVFFPFTSIILTFVAASMDFPNLSKNFFDNIHPTAPESIKKFHRLKSMLSGTYRVHDIHNNILTYL